MKQELIDLARRCGADLVGVSPASRFPAGHRIFRIYPQVKSVVGLAFRCLRGSYRGTEEGTTYYQYTTMSVENIEETVMPVALVRLSNLIESKGFTAVPQRRHQTIMEEADGMNPEVAYDSITRDRPQEPQFDFTDAAVKCGLGEHGFHGALLTDDFGPMQRTCFILSDADIEPDPVRAPHLCDRCGACVRGSRRRGRSLTKFISIRRRSIPTTARYADAPATSRATAIWRRRGRSGADSKRRFVIVANGSFRSTTSRPSRSEVLLVPNRCRLTARDRRKEGTQTWTSQQSTG